MSELRKKTLNGLVWTFGQQFGVQLINFVVSIVLARLLLPSEFGLIGMIAVFINIGNVLSDSGMNSSLIRTDNPNQIDYSTVFFTNLAISISAYLITFVSAPLIADFFDQPVLINLIRVYCLTFIIRAFAMIQVTKLTKAMEFKKQLLINVPSLVVGGIVGMILAYNGFGVWSLVYMNLFQTLMATVQLWFFGKWAPSFLYDKECLKKHFYFGYKLTVSSILNTVIKNVYNLIIGRLFSAAQLGYFIRAKSMQDLPISNISNALKKVTYPMFASIKNDESRLKEVYKRLVQQVFFWIAPVLLTAIVIAEPLFRFLLTEKWLPAVPYFQILCIAGIVTPLNSYNLNILLVKGKSTQYLRLEIIKNTLTVVGTLLVIPFGMYGLLFSLLASEFITFYINAYFCGKVLNFSIKEQLLHVSPIVVIAATGAVLCYIADYFVKQFISIDIVRLAVCTVTSFGVYFMMSYIFKIDAFAEFLNIIKRKK
jgi:teichuronic acid exporter